MKSTHDVYSRKRIIAVTHVKVMKKYDYGYLEAIKVRRDDNTLHKFKEGDFPNLNLHDIEDLLVLVQKKISNLERDVIFDLNVVVEQEKTQGLTLITGEDCEQQMSLCFTGRYNGTVKDIEVRFLLVRITLLVMKSLLTKVTELIYVTSGS
ncbi:hypothetical protein Tco_1403548 [Tanacetum coccineum]